MKYLKTALALCLIAGTANAQSATGYGSLKPASGGFPADLWAGSDGRQVVKFLSLLPETVLSPSTHELLRRALLTVAPAPNGMSEEEFAKARITALLKIGDASDAGAILRTVPADPQMQSAAQEVVNGEFMAGQDEAACLDVRSLAPKYNDAFWQKAMNVCQIDAGQASQGDTSLSSPPTGVEIGMLRAMHQPMPAVLFKSEDLLTLGGIARTPTVTAGTRVEAAYAAAAQSAFSAPELLALYKLPGAGQAGDEGISRNNLTERMAEAAHREAALVQQIDGSKDSNEHVRLLRDLLATDSDIADTPYFVRVEFLKQVTITTDRNALAPEAARGLLLEGDLSNGKRWYEIAEKSGGAEPLWPLAHIAFGGDAAGLKRWAETTIAADPENGPKRVERALAAISALGEDIPDALWSEAVGKPDDDASIMGSMAMSAAMSHAAQAGSRGEVIVLAALVLKDGPGHAHPMNLNHAVGALWHVGLQNQARAVALEGLAPATVLAAK